MVGREVAQLYRVQAEIMRTLAGLGEQSASTLSKTDPFRAHIVPLLGRADAAVLRIEKARWTTFDARAEADTVSILQRLAKSTTE